MNREIHVRFWESAGVKLPRATQHPKARPPDAIGETVCPHRQVRYDVLAGSHGRLAQLHLIGGASMISTHVGVDLRPTADARRLSWFAAVMAAVSVLSFPVVPLLLVMAVVGFISDEQWEDATLFPICYALHLAVLGGSIAAF